MLDEAIGRIKENFRLYKTSGASDELISEAERQLNLHFSDEYRKYLSQFGAISFGPTELTGLNVGSHANVVSVTLREAEGNSSFPKGSIVVENIGIDGVLALQDENGEVYEWQDGNKGSTFRNLAEYLESRIGV